MKGRASGGGRDSAVNAGLPTEPRVARVCREQAAAVPAPPAQQGEPEPWRKGSWRPRQRRAGSFAHRPSRTPPGNLTYPLIAPAVRPLTNRRMVKRKMRTSGMAAIE